MIQPDTTHMKRYLIIGALALSVVGQLHAQL
jgi:hypothetical protein